MAEALMRPGLGTRLPRFARDGASALGAILGIALLAGVAQAQEIGLVTGRVTDQVTARPVAGAIVRLTPTGVPSRTTRTDEGGFFVFRRVVIGAAFLDVRLIGFEQVQRTIQVDTIGTEIAVRMRR